MENNASCREELQRELTACPASRRLKESSQKQKLPRVRLRGCMEGGRGRDRGGEGRKGATAEKENKKK